MKKLLAFVLLLWAAQALNGQVYTEVQAGEYAISTYDLGQTDRIVKATRRYWSYTGSGTLIADTVFYVEDGAAMPTITGVPSNKRVAVLLERGGTWNTTITVPRNNVIYSSYGSGAKPVIYGSQTVTGWTEHSGTIYKATFNTATTQLFVDGEKMSVARLTALDGYEYTPIATVSGTVPKRTITLTGINLPTDSLAGATLVSRTEEWKSNTHTISASDGASVTISADAPGNFTTGTGVVLMNKLSFLNQPYEWYSDGSYVYLFAPSGGSPAGSEVRASTLDNGIVLDGKNNISIKNLDFRQQKMYGVKITGTAPENIKIQNCNFDGQDNQGILAFIDSQGKNLTITGNTFSNIAGGAMYGIRCQDLTVTNNHISRIGMFRHWGISTKAAFIENMEGAGIHFNQQTGANGGGTISYNTLDSMGQGGINIMGDYDITYNYIKNTCLVKGDKGAIYTYGAQDYYANLGGATIANNIIDWVEGNTAGFSSTYKVAYGLYLDNRTHGVTLVNNTVVNASRGGIFMHQANVTWAHTVRYNKVINSGYGLNMRGSMAADTLRQKVSDNTFVAASATYEADAGYQRMMRVFDIDYSATITPSPQRAKLNSNGNLFISPYQATVFNTYVLAAGATSGGTESNVNITSYRSTFSRETNSTFEGTALTAGETQRLVYNPTTIEQTFYFNNASALKDSALASIGGTSFVLQPFRSKYVRGLAPDCIQMYTDAVAPTMTAFVIPATTDGVAVTVTTFTASADAVKYLITESAATPVLTDPNWSNFVPSAYMVSSEGTKTLYAWARDAAGNISASLSDATVVTYDTESLTDGLAAIYDFEETSGRAQDGSGNNLHASADTPAGVTINQTGNPGQAYSFNGTTGATGRILVADNNLLDFTSEMTITVWVNLSTTDKLNPLIYKGQTDAYQYRISVNTANKIQFDIYQAGAGTAISLQITGTTALQANTNYLVECNTNSILNRSGMQIWINGVQETVTTGGNATITGVSNGAGSLMFGSASYSTSGLNGKLSQAALWNRTLTAYERSILYNNGAGLSKSGW